MSKITIKNPELTVTVFSKEGSEVGTFKGSEATNVMVFLEKGITSWIEATDTKGVTHIINPDCICSATKSVTTTETTFDDMSTPFGCCGEDRTTTTTTSTSTTTTTTTTTTR